MTYLIAVVSDRIQAENAYTVLEKANFTPKQIMIVGTGYKSPDDLGLVDTKLQGMKRARFMAYWLVPFGFIAGYGFDLITGLNTFAWAENLAIILWAVYWEQWAEQWVVSLSVAVLG